MMRKRYSRSVRTYPEGSGYRCDIHHGITTQNRILIHTCTVLWRELSAPEYVVVLQLEIDRLGKNKTCDLLIRLLY